MFALDNIGQAVMDRRWGRPPIEDLAVCEARLTLSSGNPIPTSSVTAATSVYLATLGRGNLIKLYDTAFKQWAPRIVDTEKSVAIPSTLFRLFDIWAYWTGVAVALETTNWNQTTAALTAATAAAPSVITSAGHGLSNGDLVGLAGLNNTAGTDATNGLNGTVWPVANVAANTFECAGSDTSALVASTTGTWYKIPNTRATALVQQDGVYCKTGDLSRRYLGTGMTTGVSGQSEYQFGAIGTPGSCLLWNFYNQREIELRAAESGDSWTYTNTWRPLNLHGKLNRCGFVVGLDEQQIEAFALANAQQTLDAVSVGAGLDLDGLAGNDCFLRAAPATDLLAPDAVLTPFANLRAYPGIGFHFVGQTEKSVASGTATWHGDAGDPDMFQSGMTLKVWC